MVASLTSAVTVLRAATMAPLPMRTPGPTKQSVGNPHLVSDFHRFADYWEIQEHMIMRPGTDVGTLRDYGVRTNGNGGNAVNLGVVSNPAMVTEGDKPGVGDAGTLAHQDLPFRPSRRRGATAIAAMRKHIGASMQRPLPVQTATPQQQSPTVLSFLREGGRS